MESEFYGKLVELLKTDSRFVEKETGELLKSEVINTGLKLDKKLIADLLSVAEFKEKFFMKIGETLVFDTNLFQKFLQDKKFLSNSYTDFKNKIGLNIDGKYLKERGEVSLVFPFKDCVLAGRMTKEEQKRDEIFFNEILAQDEIDRLRAPKVFSNFKKFTASEESKISDFQRDEAGTIKDNLIIKGNNLLALHSLKQEFQGKVQLIYIDPPYNTGNDGFKYNDNFNHSSWLTFMKNRLQVAKDLLRDDGVILTHMDYHEIHYGKVLMDEIFGVSNFQREIIWFKGNTFGYAASAKNFVLSHDSILFYSNNSQFSFNKHYLPYPEEYIKERFVNDDNDDKGKYRLQGKNQKQYLKDSKGTPIPDVWNIPVVNVMAKEKYMSTQKPEKLMERIIQAFTNKNDIVLDYHLGSGTTCAVAHKMGRKYIGIEQMDYVETIAVERLKKVIAGEQGGISKAVDWKGGGEFVYFELKKYNQEAVEKLDKAESTEELLRIWQEMCERYFLNYDVDIKKFNENQEDFKKLPMMQQKQHLLEMLNKNQLYVNLSEMEDSQFEISEEDKSLTKKFYRK